MDIALSLNFTVAFRDSSFNQLCEELHLRYQLLLLWIAHLWDQHSCSWEIWQKGLSGSQTTLAVPGLSFVVGLILTRALLDEGNYALPVSNLAINSIQGSDVNPFEVGSYSSALSSNSSFLESFVALSGVSPTVLRSSLSGVLKKHLV